MMALRILTVVRLGREFGRADEFSRHSDCMMACSVTESIGAGKICGYAYALRF